MTSLEKGGGRRASTRTTRWRFGYTCRRAQPFGGFEADDMSLPPIFTPEYYAHWRDFEARHWWTAGMRDVGSRGRETQQTDEPRENLQGRPA